LEVLVVRKNNNAGYCFAFIEYEPGFDAQKVIDKYQNNYLVFKASKSEANK